MFASDSTTTKQLIGFRWLSNLQGQPAFRPVRAKQPSTAAPLQNTGTPCYPPFLGAHLLDTHIRFISGRAHRSPVSGLSCVMQPDPGRPGHGAPTRSTSFSPHSRAQFFLSPSRALLNIVVLQLCSKAKPCKTGQTCCPVTNECVTVGAACVPPVHDSKPTWVV